MNGLRVSGKLCESGEVVCLTIAGGRIAAIERGSAGAELGGPDVWISPAFIDLQVNGYGGCDFNVGDSAQGGDSDRDLDAILPMLARSGTALFCPTVTTESRGALTEALGRIAHLSNSCPLMARAIVGIHLEGPYIAPEDGPRGAHPLEHVREPDWDEFQHLQEAAEGQIRIVTLAPERPGALSFIEKAVEMGVVVAIGHTRAEPETIRDAVSAGASMSTHLGNGAHALIPRHPNYIWEQLACDDLYASIITDGHHLPPSVARCMARVKGPEKLVLVSDAVALGGMPAGRYGPVEVLPSGRIEMSGTSYLAGAGHLLDLCVANAMRFTGLSLAQVTRCVTAIPARILGLEASKGHVQVGRDADLTLFRVPDDGPLQVTATLLGGELLYRA